MKKNRINVALCVAFCIAVFGACFSEWKGTGAISINLGGSVRVAVNGIPAFNVTSYTVTLVSSDKVIGPELYGKDVKSIVVPVSPGTWTVQVRAEGTKTDSTGSVAMMALGSSLPVNVAAGITASANVTMQKAQPFETVSKWGRLCDVFKEVSDSGGSKIIEITEGFVTDGFVAGEFMIASLAGNFLGTTITLVGSDSKSAITLHHEVTGSLFNVGSNGTLILQDITLKGKGTGPNDINNAPLIEIYGGGELIMEAGSKITDNQNAPVNEDSHGGGVHVTDGTLTMEGGTISGNAAWDGGGVQVEKDGIFTMNGGTISNNSAQKGGGVYITGGTFIKTGSVDGGSIYGNDASKNEYGHAVYYMLEMTGAGVYRDADLNHDDTLSTANITEGWNQ